MGDQENPDGLVHCISLQMQRHWQPVDSVSLNTIANIVTAICAVIITIKVL